MSKILDFLKPGVITGDDVQKVFKIARQNNFALPAVNCIGTDSINSALEVAAKVRSPIIIQFSNGGANFIAGKGIKSTNQTAAVLGGISGALHVHHMAKYYNASVILHTDHCVKKNLSWIDGLLDAGEKHYARTGTTLFSSHMIDLSEEPLEQNIEISVKYLTRMVKLGMTLEVELGCTGGEEDGVDNSYLDKSTLYTKPEDVAYAYEKLSLISSNFIIAAAFGNVHGVYKKGNVELIPTILDNSQKYVAKKFNLQEKPLNLVFHGGSGSSLKDIQEAIKCGVIKMNIDTDIQWATWKGIMEYYKMNESYMQAQIGNPEGANKPNKQFYDPRAWIRAAQISTITSLEQVFKTLNAVNLL
ncbi:fructose-bisphosphate aldolase, class II [secondary endosymbiont of Heteropsylla cubana]|uniref:Fructose-bisphosphate aldolase n=1 Tax=secondary endosymbiont of Heteropsylla cubana TaxID=134287 RepID=J3YT38_9ENTR|nr:class II fructose-bisphosphate aldolase [secondary endosymbiont of Heteropsylla cubana]AFP85573.1 fructose-bisphosphate aldolase, class II [secondary endosymbiont of Heteropsylla cubana]